MIRWTTLLSAGVLILIGNSAASAQASFAGGTCEAVLLQTTERLTKALNRLAPQIDHCLADRPTPQSGLAGPAQRAVVSLLMHALRAPGSGPCGPVPVDVAFRAADRVAVRIATVDQAAAQRLVDLQKPLLAPLIIEVSFVAPADARCRRPEPLPSQPIAPTPVQFGYELFADPRGQPRRFVRRDVPIEQVARMPSEQDCDSLGPRAEQEWGQRGLGVTGSFWLRMAESTADEPVFKLCVRSAQTWETRYAEPSDEAFLVLRRQ
jgi:hypothetical protein